MIGPARCLGVIGMAGALLVLLGGFGPERSPSPPRDFTLKSASIELPQDFDQMFPDGPDVDAVNGNCRACHSPSMVLVQPKLPKAGWEKIVTKMVTAYHAPIAAGDVPKIVNYLDHLKG